MTMKKIIAPSICASKIINNMFFLLQGNVLSLLDIPIPFVYFYHEVCWTPADHVFKPGHLDSKHKDQLEGAQDSCLAVIPWIPSQVSSSSGTEGFVSGSQLTQEQKEAEDDEVAFMEIEEDRQQATSGGLGSEGFQQQQQHCLNAQLPPKSSNSVMWSW